VNAHKARPHGDLPTARRHLEDAIRDLTQPRTAFYNDQKRHAPSLYMQLAASVTGEQGVGYNGAHKSQPPLWIDAADLLNEIDTAVAAWQPQPAGIPPTVGRLKAIAGKGWRVEDVKAVKDITTAVQLWCKQITNLLAPESVKHFRDPEADGYAACPQCGRKTTYREDPSGEAKRVPALQWAANTGTSCVVCKAHWAPDRTLFLATVLGFQLPAGVLE
jgi:hypothetical protein